MLKDYYQWENFFLKKEEAPRMSDGYCDVNSLIQTMEQVEGNAEDGTLSTEEIKRAIKDSVVGPQLRRLACKHPTEWSTKTDQKIKKYDTVLSETFGLERWLESDILPFIESLQWWDDVFPVTVCPAEPEELWFFFIGKITPRV